GWQLNGFYTHLGLDSTYPTFLTSGQGNNFSNYSGNDFGVNGSHSLPWKGSVSLAYNHATYGGDAGATINPNTTLSNYTTDNETAVVNLHPSQKLTLFADQEYTNNLNGFFYQN